MITHQVLFWLKGWSCVTKFGMSVKRGVGVGVRAGAGAGAWVGVYLFQPRPWPRPHVLLTPQNSKSGNGQQTKQNISQNNCSKPFKEVTDTVDSRVISNLRGK